jgi:hypothetical protein
MRIQQAFIFARTEAVDPKHHCVARKATVLIDRGNDTESHILKHDTPDSGFFAQFQFYKRFDFPEEKCEVKISVDNSKEGRHWGGT